MLYIAFDCSKLRYTLPFLGLLLLPALLVGSTGIAAPQTLKLLGDFLAMASIRGGVASELYVVTLKASTSRGGRGQKQIEVYQKSRDGLLIRSRVIPLDRDVVAFDICPLSGAPQVDEFLLIGPKGVSRTPPSQPLLNMETILAHEREDVFPRVKICFPIFSGEGPSIVIPRLHGIDLYRQKQPGFFVRYAQFPIHADARYQWPILRGALGSTQRVAVRFEFPDLTAPDFNGDGLADLCFTSPEYVTCQLQDRIKGFLGSAPPIEYPVQVMTSAERKNTSIRVDSRLVDLTGDGRPELVVTKSSWNLSDIGVSLYVFHQDPKALFQSQPVQVLKRSGYFGFQEYRDHDRDGLLDIVAPVASTSWTDIAAAYLTKRVGLDFVWYKNKGGRFADQSTSLHALGYPIDFKNWASLLGALPLWDVRFGQKSPGVMFFPMAESLEMRTIQTEHGISSSDWNLATDVGGEVSKMDLDLDQRDEIAIAFPRDSQRSQTLKFINTPVLDPK